jgi:hypothetical protein
MIFKRVVAASVAVALSVFAYWWLADKRQSAEVFIRAPQVISAADAPVPNLLSEVNVGLSLKIESLANAIDAFLPRAFSGVEDDPLAAATQDRLTWSLSVGSVTLGSQGGAMSFSIPISDGMVTVAGRVGAQRKHNGTLGWFEKLAGFNFNETVEFEGVISGVLRPRMRGDWTIDPGLQAQVSLSRAEAELFGGMLKVSFRDVIKKRIEAEIGRQAEQMRRRMADDGRIVSAVQRVWDAMHAVVSLSSQPPVWLTWQPVGLAVSQPQADADHVSITVGTMVRATIDVVPEKPLVAIRDLPRPTTPRYQDRVALRVPVTMRLDRFQSMLPTDIGLPNSIETADGTVVFKSLSIFGAADELTIAADVRIDIDWMAGFDVTLYVTGTPLLDRDNNTLSLSNARYDVHTRNALISVAEFMLEPAILAEIEKRSVFEILEAEGELLRRARAEIEVIETSLPSWVEADLDIDTGQVSSVSALDGWLIAVLEVTGSARVQIGDFEQLLEPPAD